MRRAYIEGINGSIEVTNKFIYVIIGKNKNYFKKAHVVLFEEIEDITYKKPTSSTYGYISLYLFTKDNTTNEKIKYTIILDKNNQKDLDSNKKLFDLINQIAWSNRDIKLKEDTNEEQNEIEEYKEDIKEDSKENTPTSFNVPLHVGDKKNEEEKESLPKNIPIDTPHLGEKNNTLEESIKEEKHHRDQISKSIKTIEEKEIEKNKNLSTIDVLEKKLHNLEKELITLSYKELILNKYIDESREKDEIEKLIIEIKILIEELEKIKKEISSQEKTLNFNDFLTLDNGKVIVTNISKKLIEEDKLKLESHIDAYKSTVKRANEIEEKIELLSERADEKKDEISLSDEDYDKDVNLLKGVKTAKEFIEKYRMEAEEDIKNVKKEIETTINQKTRSRFVHSGISTQTRLLASMLTLNSLRKGKSRLSTFALSLATGISALTDMVSFEQVQENYNEVVKKETLIGIEDVDTKKARSLIEESSEQITKILEECEKKYSDYPNFIELKEELLDIKEEIDKESKELEKTEEQLKSYEQEPKVKILSYTQE